MRNTTQHLYNTKPHRWWQHKNRTRTEEKTTTILAPQPKKTTITIEPADLYSNAMAFLEITKQASGQPTSNTNQKTQTSWQHNDGDPGNMIAIQQRADHSQPRDKKTIHI